MRERLANLGLQCSIVGITPARAGKTVKILEFLDLVKDHPRSCGTDRRGTRAYRIASGSPPLVRERLDWGPDRQIFTGITPARAGKTCRSRGHPTIKRDHPRSCGKDSNGFLYLRHFALAGIQNLFNFFAEYLSTKKHKARFAKIQLSQPPI